MNKKFYDPLLHLYVLSGLSKYISSVVYFHDVNIDTLLKRRKLKIIPDNIRNEAHLNPAGFGIEPSLAVM